MSGPTTPNVWATTDEPVAPPNTPQPAPVPAPIPAPFTVEDNLGAAVLNVTNTAVTTSQPLTAAAPVTVTGAFQADAKGHLLALAAAAPALSAPAADLSGQAVSGNDARGTITFNVVTAAIAAQTALLVVTFAQAFAAKPVVLLQSGTIDQFYVVVTATGFTLYNVGSLAIANGYSVSFLILG